MNKMNDVEIVGNEVLQRQVDWTEKGKGNKNTKEKEGKVRGTWE